jgi:hypothetical protein
MEEDANLVNREQYIEMLIDASFWDASEMESGFTSWCERHVPTWRKQGYDESWIRQRIETAHGTLSFNRWFCRETSLTVELIPDEAGAFSEFRGADSKKHQKCGRRALEKFPYSFHG